MAMNELLLRSRALMMQGGKEEPSLPDEYQEVEWIMNDVNSYINTNLLCNSLSKIVQVVQLPLLTEHTEEYIETDGVYPADNATNLCTYSVGYSNASRGFSFCYYYGNNSPTGTLRIYGISLNFHTFILDGYNKRYYIDDTAYTIPNRTFSCNNPYYLFACNYCGRSVNITFMSHYVKKIIMYQDGIDMSRNFIPCYRKSDGVVGMYDLCGSICPLTNSPFYISSGSGSFSKGPDVN